MIAEFNRIINEKEYRDLILIDKISKLRDTYGDTRRTQLLNLEETSKEDKEIEFVEPEKCVVIMTEGGLIKRIPTTSFKVQKRNGKGVKTQDDITNSIIKTNTIDSLMIFSNKGKMYRLLVNDIPVGTNSTKGVHVGSLLELDPGEKPSIIYSIYRDTDAKFVLFVTKQGIVKKTSLEEYIKTKKKTGIAAITLREGDELAAVSLVKNEQIILITERGMGIKFKTEEISPTSRATTGVKGITLGEDDKVIAALPIRNEQDRLALFTYNGLGKKILMSELPLQKRAGKGIICYKPNDSTGILTSAVLISDEDALLVMGNKNSICISAKDIPELGRPSMGNLIIKDEKVNMVSKI